VLDQLSTDDVMNDTLIQTKNPETAEFTRWIESERQKGLVDVKFFKRDTESSTVESFCAEVNQMLRALEVNDPDFN
jgi:hypothetical protein